MNRWNQGRVTDVVCRMRIRPEDATGTEDYQGRAFHFCSAACQERFQDDPAFYARLADPEAAAALRGER
jgi:P-type Cu+ transporter